MWFFEMYLKVFDKDLPNNLDICQWADRDFSPLQNIVDHEEDFDIEEDFDHFDDHILLNFNTAVQVVWHKFSDDFPCNINFKVWVSINSAFSWGFEKFSNLAISVIL